MQLLLTYSLLLWSRLYQRLGMVVIVIVLLSPNCEVDCVSVTAVDQQENLTDAAAFDHQNNTRRNSEASIITSRLLSFVCFISNHMKTLVKVEQALY